MIIFALTATVLFALAGLGVDASVRYLASAAAERAAAAGATAGVVDMPNDWAGANSLAVQATVANGFDPAVADDRNVSVTVSRYPSGCIVDGTPDCDSNRLTVTVSEDVPTTFLQIIGIGTGRVTSTETAEYLRPIELGQPSGQFGSDDQNFGVIIPNPDNDPAITAENNSNAFMALEQGWGVDRDNGDALTPDPLSAFSSSPTNPDLHADSAIRDTDIVGAGVTDRGGYNYLIWVPANQQVYPQIFNPGFAPDQDYVPTGSSAVPMPEGNYMPNNGSDYTHNLAYYATMSYTTFKVSNVYDRNSDVQVARTVVKPIDAWGAPTTFVNVNAASCPAACPNVPKPAYFHTWYNIAGPPTDLVSSQFINYTSSASVNPATPYLDGGTNGQFYRLRVETLKADGTDMSQGTPTPVSSMKFYSIRTTDASSGTACSGCNVSAINDLATVTMLNTGPAGATLTMPLFKVPPEYAGRKIKVDVFDPGDLGANPTATSFPTSMELSADRTTVAPGSQINLTALVNVLGGGTFDCPQTPGGNSITFSGGPAPGLSDSDDPCNHATNGEGDDTVDTTGWPSGSYQLQAHFRPTDPTLEASDSNTITITITGPASSCAFTGLYATKSLAKGSKFQTGGNVVDPATGAYLLGSASLVETAGPQVGGLGTDTTPDLYWKSTTLKVGVHVMYWHFPGPPACSSKSFTVVVTAAAPTPNPTTPAGGGGGGGTSTPVPTATPKPTKTPGPSGTPAPTSTAVPTAPPSSSPIQFSAVRPQTEAMGASTLTQALGIATSGGTPSVVIGVSDPTGTPAQLAPGGLVDLGPSLDGSMPCPDFGGICPVASDWAPDPSEAAVATENTSGQNLFNGKWVEFTIQVPSDYNPGPDTGTNWYWSLYYAVGPNVSTHDAITIDVNPGNSPVHLLAPG